MNKQSLATSQSSVFLSVEPDPPTTQCHLGFFSLRQLPSALSYPNFMSGNTSTVYILPIFIDSQG